MVNVPRTRRQPAARADLREPDRGPLTFHKAASPAELQTASTDRRSPIGDGARPRADRNSVVAAVDPAAACRARLGRPKLRPVSIGRWRRCCRTDSRRSQRPICLVLVYVLPVTVVTDRVFVKPPRPSGVLVREADDVLPPG